jgi:multiple antibiotic resistance protein
MGILEIALMLFIIANPIGGIPIFVALVKDFDFQRQKVILFREAFFSLILAYFFLFLGEPFLRVIHIEDFAIRLSGGVIVFLISIQMIFPSHAEGKSSKSLPQEPFMVPIATPLISGAGVFASIIIAAKQAPIGNVALAILIAWIPVFFFVVASAFFQKILGKRGLIAMEQLMGMFLMMISLELFLKGAHMFMARVHGV